MERSAMPSTERRNDENSFHVHYMQMQRNSMDSISSFYSLSSGSLPSHFRSISPKPEVRVTIETDDDKSLSKCNTRTVYIILAAIFIVSSSVAVTIAVHEIQRVIQEESAAILPNYKHLNGSADEEAMATNGDVRTIEKETFETSTHFQDPELNDPRTQCFKRCTAYDKPKFESRCEAGFCECHGKDYQLSTCLPSVDGCIISKEINSRSTFIWGASTTAFHCSRHTGNTAHDVHVIGIYGNHFSESTLVNIERSLYETKPLTIVLASHYPVRWKIKHKNLPISEIILLSDNKLSTSQAELLNTLEVSSATLAIIRTEYFPVGYGDDRYHSNSSEMFKNINKFIGPVKSFLGTNFADKIILKL